MHHSTRARQTLRGTALLSAAAAMLFALAACSGKRDAATAPGGATPSIEDVLPLPYREIWASWRGDLDGMIDRRMIRVVTPYGGYMYYFNDGEPRGATWELANRFEDELNAELGRRNIRVFVVVIPLSRDQLIPALLEGHADIIAADLTRTELRREDVAFTRPLLTDVNEIIVTGPAAPRLESLDDLAGRDIHVRASSSYFEHLGRLSDDFRARKLKPPVIVPVDELLESEDILDMVNAGMIGMTVLDDYKAGFWSEVFADIEVRDDLVVHEGGSIAWVIRKDEPQLLQRLNTFLRRFGRGTLIGNDTYNRYLQDARELRCSRAITSGERLQQIADTFQKYGERYEFDWLKLAAQGFQESRLRHNRENPSGAVGIMQIKPTTAADPNVGIDDISDVDSNIHAGTKYLRFLADRYFADTDINELDRWLLSLAAYNAGPSRVISMRDEAAANGYDPNVWFNNVEIVAARRIGAETVTYVSNIFKYYTGYQMAAAKFTESRRRFGAMLDTCGEQ